MDKHSVRDWKRPLYTHKNMIFFSDIDSSNYRILHKDDPDLDIIRTDRRQDETILDHIDRTQHSQPDQPPSQMSSTQPSQDPPLAPTFVLRRADDGTKIRPFNPRLVNLRLRRARRNASSSDSEGSDSEEPAIHRRYGRNIYPAFPPVPYTFQTNPLLKHVRDTQARISEELNEICSRTLEWKRNETQIYLANQLLHHDTTPTPPSAPQTDHTYSQPVTTGIQKINLHSSWETPHKKS